MIESSDLDRMLASFLKTLRSLARDYISKTYPMRTHARVPVMMNGLEGAGTVDFSAGYVPTVKDEAEYFLTNPYMLTMAQPLYDNLGVIMAKCDPVNAKHLHDFMAEAKCQGEHHLQRRKELHERAEASRAAQRRRNARTLGRIVFFPVFLVARLCYWIAREIKSENTPEPCAHPVTIQTGKNSDI